MKARLQKEFFLDKYFFPLAYKITEELEHKYRCGNPSIDSELLQDIVFDVLTKVKPTYKEAKEDMVREGGLL